MCPNLVIDIFCKGGRRRSVGEGTLIGIILEKLKIPFVWYIVKFTRDAGDGRLRGVEPDAMTVVGSMMPLMAYDAVVENSKGLWTKVVQMMERKPRPPVVPASAGTVVDLTTTSTLTATSTAVGTSAGSSTDEVAALQGQITKLTEMVEKLANDKGKKDGRSKASGRRRRSKTSRTRSRSRG